MTNLANIPIDEVAEIYGGEVEQFEAMRSQQRDHDQAPVYKHDKYHVCPHCYAPVYRDGYPDLDTRDCVER